MAILKKLIYRNLNFQQISFSVNLKTKKKKTQGKRWL